VNNEKMMANENHGISRKGMALRGFRGAASHPKQILFPCLSVISAGNPPRPSSRRSFALHDLMRQLGITLCSFVFLGC
jgi:hypothetical protein